MKKNTLTNSRIGSNASSKRLPGYLVAAALWWASPFALAQAPSAAGLTLESTSAENRQVVFTNKRSAFHQTQTHMDDHPEHAWFRGFHIAGRRIFQDVRVTLDGDVLDRTRSRATVTPLALHRVYAGGINETLQLYDHQDVLGLVYAGTKSTPSLQLSGDGLSELGPNSYVVKQPDGRKDFVAVATNPSIAMVAVGDSVEAARALASRALREHMTWQRQREQRMNALIGGENRVEAGDDTEALRWMTLSLDALVTTQRGEGIYAGLPWFPEYWGRDQFISLPGATLVNGRFEVAQNILRAFARFQDRDPESPFYGRLPNIVKADALDYHTTDGTPRFVIALRDYVDYSGDLALARELYPVVHASVEGSIKRFTDSDGYLLHADNETWMDARREPDKVSYSPRANRANDIQALWIAQLRAAAQFATLSKDTNAAQEWTALANRVEQNFRRDFVRDGVIADHLNADGTRDTQTRPNAFFALELLPPSQRASETQRLWSRLVYPWGVATLDAADPQFLPYHWAPGEWHKDAAYHNGTVWPWLDGIAMQRMIEAGRPDVARRTFEFNNQMALKGNGTLPETMDAWPRPGQTLPRQTGTHSQAWSLAEQLRVWNQWFAGIRPQLSQGRIILAPRLDPNAPVRLSARIGNGRLSLEQSDGALIYRSHGLNAIAMLDMPGFETVDVELHGGTTVHVRGASVRITHDYGKTQALKLTPQSRPNRIINDVKFATPTVH